MQSFPKLHNNSQFVNPSLSAIPHSQLFPSRTYGLPCMLGHRPRCAGTETAARSENYLRSVLLR